MTRVYANLDADESVFFSRQLEYVKTKTYDRKYPTLMARTLFPVSFDVNPGAKTITYQQWDWVGMAKIISNYARDIPRVDLRGKEFTGNIRSLADSYGYSIQDVRAARMAGVPLETRKAAAAKQAILMLEDEIALNGDADHKLHGLNSHPNIPDVAIPADGTGSSALWSTKTDEQIIRDVNLLVSSIVDGTNGVETPDTLVLPLGAFQTASTKKVGDTGKTVRQWILETSPYIKNIIVWPKLKGAGAGGTDLMFAYQRDPEKLTLEIPQDFEQFPVQEKGLEFEINCHERFAGLIVYYPLSVAKADGI